MTETDVHSWPAPRASERFYYGWVVLVVAALAMVGTLPGRTQGLGLVTEPLLQDLGISRVGFAQVNLVATLIGSLFCAGVGRFIDRSGSRIVLTSLSLVLGLVVVGMSLATSLMGMLVFVTLTRGLGQSALSVVSLAMVGKWFRRRLTRAMAVYALAMSVGFMVAFPLVGAYVLANGWRAAWAAIGLCLIVGLAPLAWLLDRSSPEAIGLQVDGRDAEADGPPEPGAQATLGEALRSPAFWVFAFASSVYGLVASGIGLFNQSILAERGFAPEVYHSALAVTAITALARVSTIGQVMAQAVAMGIAGGFVMVVFFSLWGRAYGRMHLGRILGAAQAMTVVASAIGPVFLALWVDATGSYAAAFYALAAVVAVLAVAAMLVPVPPGAEPARVRAA